MNTTRILQSTDVVVIGAGAAGMTAAFDLVNAGYSVTILEASNKIGGRTKKDETLSNFPIDLGGEWLQVNKNTKN
jgi:monoamine oxidase